jgi:hypothetical protein
MNVAITRNPMDGKFGVLVRLGQYSCKNFMPDNFTRNMMQKLAN